MSKYWDTPIVSWHLTSSAGKQTEIAFSIVNTLGKIRRKVSYVILLFSFSFFFFLGCWKSLLLQNFCEFVQATKADLWRPHQSTDSSIQRISFIINISYTWKAHWGFVNHFSSPHGLRNVVLVDSFGSYKVP